MAYKSIFSIFSTTFGLQSSLETAALLALGHDAHLETLALGVDQSQLGYSYIGGTPMLMELSMQRAQDEVQTIKAALGKALKSQPVGLRWSIESAVSQLGVVSDLVGARARYADLVVLPKPYGDKIGPEGEAVLEAALFEGMAPVLLAPETPLATHQPKRVVLGWNQSREAMVAARRALPFLKAAEQVVITVVDPPSHGPERSDPGGMLCQLLVRHGIKAEVQVLARTLPRISQVLARQCQDLDADLLVMGAYGHSRIREFFVGSNTTKMISKSHIPLLLLR